MLIPHKDYVITEWGIERLVGNSCPSSACSSKLTYFYTCSYCKEVNLSDSVLCSNCGDVTYLRPNVVCSSCSYSGTDSGWKRKYYSSTAPTYLQNTPVLQGALYSTVQHYLTIAEAKSPNSPHLADLVIDIDKEDFNEAVLDTYKFIAYFRQYKVPHFVYFSGSKGFHIVVPLQAIGATPHVRLHQKVYKSMVKHIADTVDALPDMSIYSHARMFRLPNTKHLKTGLYKTLINTLIDDLYDAKSLATIYNPTNLPDLEDISVNEHMHTLYLESLKGFPNTSHLPNFVPKSVNHRYTDLDKVRFPACVRDILDNGIWVPKVRNSATFVLASFFKLYNLDYSLLEDWVIQVAGISTTSPEERLAETRRIIEWVKTHPTSFSCSKLKELGLGCSNCKCIL